MDQKDLFEKGAQFYIVCTIGLTPVLNVSKVKVIRVNKKMGAIYSLRVRVMESFSANGSYTYHSEDVFRTYRVSLFGEPYEIFTDRGAVIARVDRFIDNQQKMLEIHREDILCFTPIS